MDIKLEVASSDDESHTIAATNSSNAALEATGKYGHPGRIPTVGTAGVEDQVATPAKPRPSRAPRRAIPTVRAVRGEKAERQSGSTVERRPRRNGRLAAVSDDDSWHEQSCTQQSDLTTYSRVVDEGQSRFAKDFRATSVFQ